MMHNPKRYDPRDDYDRPPVPVALLVGLVLFVVFVSLPLIVWGY